MSKYIIELDDTIKAVQKFAVLGDGRIYTHQWEVEDLEELNSDYINEHFGDMQDEAYQHGYKDCETRYCSFDACPNRQAEYRRGLEEGKKAFDLLDEERDAEYQRGLNDAWEAAWKIMDIDDFSAMDAGLDTAFNLPVTEAIAKLKAYEEKQKADEDVKCGDVAIRIDDDKRYLVTYVDDGRVYGINEDGKWCGSDLKAVARTGEHHDIASILKDMRND